MARVVSAARVAPGASQKSAVTVTHTVDRAAARTAEDMRSNNDLFMPIVFRKKDYPKSYALRKSDEGQ